MKDKEVESRPRPISLTEIYSNLIDAEQRQFDMFFYMEARMGAIDARLDYLTLMLGNKVVDKLNPSSLDFIIDISEPDELERMKLDIGKAKDESIHRLETLYQHSKELMDNRKKRFYNM